MAPFHNPALAAFTRALGEEFRLAQVLIRRDGVGWELRQAEDHARGTTELRMLMLEEVRAVAQFTAEGEFRPLKSAPTLVAGWRCVVNSPTELEDALNRLYPGAIADWFAARTEPPPVTSYREFTGRQSGMYRVTTMLDDAQTAGVIRVCCDARACLKRRRWTVDGLGPDAPETKSAIPCLEPCAVLLDAARRTAKAMNDARAMSEASAPDPD
ncbi:MAG: hypothetical protein HY301_05515 [Verrucomicrobia bacterium]|nr:hypothetical protein [Verrucomicrobiota bacterium]